MHFEGHSHSFLHFLASNQSLGHFWAPPLMNRESGYGARYDKSVADAQDKAKRLRDPLPQHEDPAWGVLEKSVVMSRRARKALTVENSCFLSEEVPKTCL